MLLALLFLAASGAPASTSAPSQACTDALGWRDGRSGHVVTPACASLSAYAEAHRLGDAMRTLELERAAIVVELATLDEESRATRSRRQRQIDTDLEALRGVATIRGWSVAPTEEPAR